MTSGITWTNGGPLALAAKIEALGQNIEDGAATVLLEVVSQAEKNQKDTIAAAVTPTGEARVSSGTGGSPGRVDTGLMINSTTASVTRQEGGVIQGEWGWKDPEKYFMYQDEGTATIQGALSLFTSFLVAKAQLAPKLRAMIQAGGKV